MHFENDEEDQRKTAILINLSMNTGYDQIRKQKTWFLRFCVYRFDNDSRNLFLNNSTIKV
jgi:hypothetical protein